MDRSLKGPLLVGRDLQPNGLITRWLKHGHVTRRGVLTGLHRNGRWHLNLELLRALRGQSHILPSRPPEAPWRAFRRWVALQCCAVGNLALDGLLGHWCARI